jgi:Xaa-Pro aminopeptidase
MQLKINSVRNRMKDNNVDLIALGPGTHMKWLLGFNPSPDERPCMLLMGLENDAFLMPSVNAEDAMKRSDIKMFSWKDENGPDEALDEALSYTGSSNAKHIAIDEAMRSHFALLLIDALPKPTYEFTNSTIGALRMRKDDNEYSNLKENALIDDRAMQAGFAAIKEGVTELEIGEAINKHFISEGAKPQFCIVGSGPNGAFPHHHTGNRKVENGDVVLIDIGGRKGTFPSDMTRMSVVGEPPKDYLEVHAIVERAVQAQMVKKYLDESPYPTIITGDFNDVPSSYTYKTIRGNWSDSFLEKGFGIGASYLGISPTLRIDYILSNASWKTKGWESLDENLSDHHMIMADLQLIKN